MIHWFLETYPIMRYEYVILVTLAISTGVIGGIGWILLKVAIHPMKMSHYLSLIHRAVFNYWFKNQPIQGEPIGNPEQHAKDLEDRFLRSQPRPLRPVPQPDKGRRGWSEKEHENTDNEILQRPIHASSLSDEPTISKQNHELR